MTFLLLLLAALTLLYLRPGARYTLPVLIAAALVGLYLDHWHPGSILLAVIVIAAIALVALPNPWRLQYLSNPLLARVRSMLPTLSDTEQQALDAGNVDWDGEIFSGRPDWQKLLQLPHPGLSDEEQAFLDGPTEQLCTMLDDWAITHEHYDLPEPVWQFIRDNGFFGLVIPKQHGGKGFSHSAHSAVVMKLASRSISAAVTVMVPNSLGPGELLLHYGTDQQKTEYLPKLACGEHIPCFALTSPVAGSDAGAIPDVGVICHGEWQGESVLGMKVTWNKRYITLAPVATLIGLAIKAYDPDHLLTKEGEDHQLGVTCVMIPSDTAGVHAGARHLPMNTVFMNGPTWGDEVFIPLDYVIGGPDMIGKGWRMLLEVLSIGRSVSLPAMGTAAGKQAAMSTGAYAGLREQFGRSISQFEGVQEALEPIAGYTYAMDAARQFTTAMLDRGVKPSVPSAVLKYRNTTVMRDLVNNAMDVVAGRAVISGPRNFLAPAYTAVPIAITVEGANILTRSLMVFGQGAIRCHPYMVDEIEAANNDNEDEAVQQFDRVFFPHLGHTASNGVRALLLGLTRGLLASAPKEGKLQGYYRSLTRFSAAFSVLTDVGLLSLGGSLKARQRFAGRMADALSHQYYASAVIKQYKEEGYPEAHRELVHWGLQTSLAETERALFAAVTRFPVRGLRWPLRALLFPTGRYHYGPDDALGSRVALGIVEPGPMRERVIQGIFVPDDPSDPVGRVLHAAELARSSQPLRQRLRQAVQDADHNDRREIELLLAHEREALLDWAVKRDVITTAEREELATAMAAIYDAIRVDAFDSEAIKALAEASSGKLQEVDRP